MQPREGSHDPVRAAPVVAAGEGVIDFSYCVKKLCENDFNGSIITHGLTEKSAIKVFKHLQKILINDL